MFSGLRWGFFLRHRLEGEVKVKVKGEVKVEEEIAVSRSIGL
jgi:hypothetical protein